MINKIVLGIMLVLSPIIVMAEDDDKRVPVDVELTVGKTSVQVGDFIALRLKITNPLNKSVEFNLSDIYQASFIKVVDRAGRIMPWERIVLYDAPWTRYEKKVLSPGESFRILLQPSLRINNQNQFILDFVDSQIILPRPGSYEFMGYVYGIDVDSMKKDAEPRNRFAPIMYQGVSTSNTFNINIQR